MIEALTGLSSKATQHLLADLSARFEERHGVPIQIESAGGVDVARRVRDGEHADLLVLADDAMSALGDDGFLVPGTLRRLFDSEVVLAVPSAAPDPEIDTEDDLLTTLRALGRLAYSTGPSGTALLRWLERMGVAAELDSRLVQAPPGTPVATLLADRRADLGIQQRSELSGVPGVRVVGPLPGAAAITSTFSGAVLATSRNRWAGAALAFFGSVEVSERVEHHGMQRADG